MIEVGIVGNPNSGKTTLFNAITGAKQKVGNWPGVTVERKEGVFTQVEQSVKVVDLPGTYSLTVAAQDLSLDERIACDYIAANSANVILNIVDASNLERNLYLTMQLLEMGVPVIVALNMMDVAKKKNVHIDIDRLQQQLGCPVISLEAVRGKGVSKLKELIVATHSASNHVITYPAPIERAIDDILQTLPEPKQRWHAIRLLEEDCLVQDLVQASTMARVAHWQSEIQEGLEEDADILIADARYQKISEIVKTCVNQHKSKTFHMTQLIDAVVLNRFFGIPFFLLVMYCMFLFAINIGGMFQDFFDIASNTLFVAAPMHFLQQIHTPPWLIALVAQGVGKGINTVLTFIPVIGGMFFFLAFLEQSGYMARAAFVVDRMMRAVGLPGKSFVPMIVGFGCNVPAVLATRMLESRRDRILTVLMSPFMSCGARLEIFAVFTSAFFPQGGQNIVFALYLIGIFVAILTGLILRKTLLQGEPAPFVLELPLYHVPMLSTLFTHTWQRLKAFIFKAGKLIIPICVLLGFMNSFTIYGHLTMDGSVDSLLAAFGKFLTPIFSPMGVDENNWPATVGLLSGILAKEVVVGTLNTLYSQAMHATMVIPEFHFWVSMKASVLSIWENLQGLGDSLVNPLLASAPEHELSHGVMGQMYQRFDGARGAFAYLLFVLLYFPCVSTVAAMARELGKHWAWFSVAWTTGVAYGAAVIFYQVATFTLHPVYSVAWIMGLVLSFFVVLLAMRFFNQEEAVS